MERFSAASEPLSSERLKFPSWTLRPSAADAFCSMVGRNSLTGIKNGATRTSTINTPTTIRTIFNVLFMATSDPAGTSEDWVRQGNGSTNRTGRGAVGVLGLAAGDSLPSNALGTRERRCQKGKSSLE